MCVNKVSEGKGRAHTAEKTGRDCNDIQPASSPCGGWDVQRWVLQTKGIGKQTDKGEMLCAACQAATATHACTAPKAYLGLSGC
jgi:hypothetical protein